MHRCDALQLGALLTTPVAVRHCRPPHHTWKRHVRRADEASPDAAEAADAPAEPEKVDAMTYVFGKPGELQGDMARMGTSPRRLALGCLTVALPATSSTDVDVIRIAPAGVQDAARRARLDTTRSATTSGISTASTDSRRYPDVARGPGDKRRRMQARTGAGAVDAWLYFDLENSGGPPFGGPDPRRGQVRELVVFRSPVMAGLKRGTWARRRSCPQVGHGRGAAESGKKTTYSPRRSARTGATRSSTVSSCRRAATARRGASSTTSP